jgi:hypothetical protein
MMYFFPPGNQTSAAGKNIQPKAHSIITILIKKPIAIRGLMFFIPSKLGVKCRSDEHLLQT